MKSLLMSILVGSLLLLASPVIFSDETVSEKASVIGKTVKRAAKKGMHRTQEAFCAKGDLPCMADKSKHRAIELKDRAVDKVEEVNNKIN